MRSMVTSPQKIPVILSAWSSAVVPKEIKQISYTFRGENAENPTYKNEKARNLPGLLRLEHDVYRHLAGKL